MTSNTATSAVGIAAATATGAATTATNVPDLVERDVLIEAPVEVVWRIVTEPEQMNAWFSDTARLDLRAGGDGVLSFGDEGGDPMDVNIRVEAVEPPHRFAFRWIHPEGAEPRPGNSALVEFTLTAEGRHTRLRVVESGLAAMGWPQEQTAAYLDDHAKGWEHHFSRMLDHVARGDRAQAR